MVKSGNQGERVHFRAAAAAAAASTETSITGGLNAAKAAERRDEPERRILSKVTRFKAEHPLTQR